MGDLVRLRGQIFNFIGSDGFQMWVQGPSGRVAVVVAFDVDDLPANTYENSYVIVYGEVRGSYEGTNAFGGTISQPLLRGDIVER